MGKNIRKYNPETKQWEIIASGNSSGISSTNPRFLPEDEEVISIDDVVSILDEKIEGVKRNISWLAINGGGGGGGGGGSSSASIKLTNSDIQVVDGVNLLYLSTPDIVLNYLISENRNNQKYLINVSLDGNNIIYNQEGWSGTPGSLIVKNVAEFSSGNTHSIVVTATNSEGINAESYLLTIRESSIDINSSVKTASATIGLPYNITYSISNKVLGSDTALIVTNITNGISKTYNLGKFSSTEPLLYDVDFFSLFSGTPTTGSSYTIEAFAQTSIDEKIITSKTISNKVVVEDGESLVVLIEGITTKEEVNAGESPTKYVQGGNISFAFTPYLSNVNIIYYALRLKRGNIIRDVGIFDPIPGESNFYDNKYVQKGVQQIFSWGISTDEEYLGSWDVTLRCWSEKGNPVLDSNLQCEVIPSSQSTIPDQNPNNSRYARWNIKQDTFPQNSSAKVWTSHENNFILPGTLDPITVNTDLNVYNTNGVLSGFLIDKGQSFLRLSGEAYGIINYQPFIADIEDNENWSKLGFTLSVTFKTDIHPFSDRTVFCVGDYNSAGVFSEGIQVGLENVIWSYTDGNIKETITCKIQQGKVNTLDFVVDKNFSEVKIFVNGVLNAAREIKSNFTWKSSSKIYLACDNSSSNYIQNFADVNFYDIKLFRRPLNDKQIVINALNSRIISTLLDNGTIDYSIYNTWKSKNFFSTSDSNPVSMLWDDQNNTYANINFDALISDSNKKPPLPVVYINCNGSGFTKSIYEAVGANPTEYNGCIFNYFDPNSEKTTAISTGELSVQIQGTSSTGYRSKNLEIKFNKVLYNQDDGSLIGPELFQPIKTWMPENQFTLKADVVDSAHANNASIGKWINDNSDILFDKTPPMEQLENRRPVDTLETTIIHKDVTIKHTLEGFPVILLVKFDGTDTQEMLGIYSFNLGRNAYYNMGFKFFKSFSTKIKSHEGNLVNNPLPAFITSYEEYKQNEMYGNIRPSEIYSYEFSENANTIEKEDGTKQYTALFWQDDVSIIQHVGEFRYNGGTGDNSNVSDNTVWERLQLLFSDLARMTDQEIIKYRWDNNSKNYIATDETYSAQQSWSSLADSLQNRLNIRNAYSYFVICTAFGLVDSLGKNMVLRSWNVGGSTTDTTKNKWWVGFYDMDTATGLSNTGEESIAKTAYIDTFKNSEVENSVNSLVITQNSPEGGYGTYSSRLWNVLRDSRFINTGVYSGGGYNELWNSWRNVGTLLKDANYFVDNCFSIQTRDCGELLYNYDYKVKYLTKYSRDNNSLASYANIEFLHGTRTEFVRDWLSKRFMFLDGIFYYDNNSNLYPYNEKGAFKCGGSTASLPILRVKCNCPLIFTVNIGQTSAGDIRYVIQENIPTDIVLSPVSSFNTQITINGISQISELGGLKNIRFQGFMSTLRLPSFAELDLSGVNTLSGSPILFESAFINNQDYSDVRKIDLSNVDFWEANAGASTFTVNVEKYLKLKQLNISHSCVTSLSLPNASLSDLNISYSDIEKITLSSQPFLDSIDFSGCDKLKTVIIENCSKLTSLTLTNLQDLTSVSIVGCPNLTSVTCTSNPKLDTFSISNSNSIKTIDLSNCNSSALNVFLVGAPELTDLNLSGTTTSFPIQVASNLTSLKILDMSNSSITALQYGNDAVPTYEGEPVLDLTPFALTTLSLRNDISLKYLKFDNNPNKTFKLTTSFFQGCLALTRVFGHLELTGTSVFSGCYNFRIHDLPADEITPIPTQTWFGSDTSTAQGKTDWENNIDLNTNIKITTTSLASTFHSSGVNLYDVYYILSKADKITNLNSTFYNCKQIVTSVKNSLNRNTFSHCKKVTSMSSTFYSCSNMVTILYSPTHDDEGNVTAYDGIFSPLVSVTSMDLMFYGSGTKYMDDFLFYKLDSTGKTLKLGRLYYLGTYRAITNASIPRETITSSDYDFLKASRLLAYLPNITSIYYSFGGTYIDFDLQTYTKDGVTVSYCPLFYNNPKISVLAGAFTNITGKGSLLNIFGGNEIFDDLKDKFPQALSTIRYSLNIASYSGSKVVYPIHNQMFRKIKNTISIISGETSGSSYFGSNNSLSGAGLSKVFVQDNPNEVFPFDIFKECLNITEIPGFFYGLSFSDPIEVSLPGDMFINNTKLSSIGYLFYGMNNVRYTLTGKGFKNCKITVCTACFQEESLSYSKKGMIPYGLFYQDYKENVLLTGYNHEDSVKLNLSENFGISPTGEWIEDIEVPDERKYTIEYTKIRNSIRSMPQVLAGFQSPDALGYTLNYGTITYGDCGDLITFNENYNPIEYIKNKNYDPRLEIPNPAYDPNNPGSTPETMPNPNRDIRRIIKNPSYDNYKETWNIWAVDGTTGLESIIVNSKLYSDILNGTIKTISPEFPSRLFDENDSKTPTLNADLYQDSQKVMNYLCPPDLFRYCENSSSVNVKGIFYNSGRESDSGYNYLDYGIRGRICPFLFSPINKVTNLSNMFYLCKLISPYTWPTDAENGLMFSSDLFSELKGLTTLTLTFAFTEIKKNVIISPSQFINNLSLRDIDRLFMSTVWEDTVIQQVPDNLFDKNGALTNIRGLFSGFTVTVNSDGSSTANTTFGRGRPPKKINSVLFTKDKHKNLAIISHFIHNGSNTTGSVPQFWEWLNKLSSKYRSSPYYGLYKSKLTNGNNIPSGWDTGMN